MTRYYFSFLALSYEYTAEGEYTVYGGTGLAAESAKIEAFFEKQGIPITVKREEKQKPNRRPLVTKYHESSISQEIRPQNSIYNS